MALTNYAGLSAAVFRRLNRGVDSTVLDDCIALAEAEINRRLALHPVRPMHIKSTAPLSAQYVAAPDDILDVDALEIDSAQLKFTSPQNMLAMYERTDATGQPEFYTQIGSEFRVYPEPDTSYTLTMVYWAKVPNLNATDATNWLSLAHPDVYFHGALAHAYQEYFDADNADTQAGLFDAAIDKVLSAYPSRPDNRPMRTEINRLELSGRSTVFA